MNDLLKTQLGAFIDLTPATEHLIESCFKHRVVKKNEVLVAQGSIAKHLYFVVKGCLRVFMVDDAGNESTRFLILPGRFGTAFPSFILKEPSAAVVQSLEPTELLLLSYEDRERLNREVPGWETMSRKQVELEYINSIRRIESLITMKSVDRYQLLLKSNPDIVERLPARIIADYLGISQETLSRLKNQKSIE